MSDPTKQDAPALGDPTDADLGDELAEFVVNSGKVHRGGAGSDAAQMEKTMDTPDDLGGTGGGQAGGAG